MLVLTIPARERPLSPSVSSHHLPEDIFQKLWKSLTFCQYQESQWLAKVRNSVWDVEGVGMRDSLMDCLSRRIGLQEVYPGPLEQLDFIAGKDLHYTSVDQEWE